MTEHAIYIGVGKPIEKINKVSHLKEKIQKSFTVKGAKESWLKKHATDISRISDINSKLTDEERQEALSKLEKKASTIATINVAANYGALALATAALVGESLLIANPQWASKVADVKITILGKEKHILKPIAAPAKFARRNIDTIIQKVTTYRTRLEEELNKLHLQKMENLAIKHTDALSGAIKLDSLDALDAKAPFTEEFFRQAVASRVLSSTTLNNSQAESYVLQFLERAKQYGRWVPIVTLKGHEPYGYGMQNQPDAEGIGLLLKRRYVTKQTLDNGMTVFVPTEKLIGFVKRMINRWK